MNSILRRRRALMMAGQGGGETPVYELTNRAVSTGDSIDTEVAFMSSGFAGTVLLDITLNGNPTGASATARTYKLIYVGNTASSSFALFFGKTSRNAAYHTIGFYGGNESHGVWTNGAGRYKIAITHGANENTVTAKQKKDSGAVESFDYSRTYSPVTDTLHFGGPDTAQALYAGTIHSAKIYNRVLSQSEIDAFFA